MLLWGVSVLGFEAPEDGRRPIRAASPIELPTPSIHYLAGLVVAVSGIMYYSRLLAVSWLIWEGGEVVGFHYKLTCMRVIGFAPGIIKIRV